MAIRIPINKSITTPITLSPRDRVKEFANKISMVKQNTPWPLPDQWSNIFGGKENTLNQRVLGSEIFEKLLGKVYRYYMVKNFYKSQYGLNINPSVLFSVEDTDPVADEGENGLEVIRDTLEPSTPSNFYPVKRMHMMLSIPAPNNIHYNSRLVIVHTSTFSFIIFYHPNQPEEHSYLINELIKTSNEYDNEVKLDDLCYNPIYGHFSSINYGMDQYPIEYNLEELNNNIPVNTYNDDNEIITGLSNGTLLRFEDMHTVSSPFLVLYIPDQPNYKAKNSGRGNNSFIFLTEAITNFTNNYDEDTVTQYVYSRDPLVYFSDFSREISTAEIYKQNWFELDVVKQRYQ